MDRNRILEKIQKAMNLANNAAATPGEAAAALRSAQKMMEKFEVSPEELGIVGYGFETVLTTVQCTPSSKTPPANIEAIAWLVAGAFGVKILWRKRIARTDPNWSVEFYGRKDKVVVAGYTQQLLMRTIEKSWHEFLAARPHLKKERGARYSFAVGFVHAVREQVTAIALTDEDKAGIEQVIKQNGVVIAAPPEKEKKRPELNGRVARAGIAAAEDFRLHRPIA